MQKLRDARIRKGLKQSEVAEKIGCAPTSLTNWENGHVNPPLEILERMCQIYEISPLDLLEHYPTISEIHAIASKPIIDRNYEESVALNFSGTIPGWPEDSMTAEEVENTMIIRNLNSELRDIILNLTQALGKIQNGTVDTDVSKPKQKRLLISGKRSRYVAVVSAKN